MHRGPFLTAFVQLPPFWHGFNSQYGTCRSHKFPVQPSRQMHRKSLTSWTQSCAPSPVHGLARHSFMSPSQRGPTNPGAQMQSYLLTRSTHVPPWWQAPSKQLSSLISQSMPMVPDGHEHRKASTRSWQVPPFWHGRAAHSSTSYSQLIPW